MLQCVLGIGLYLSDILTDSIEPAIKQHNVLCFITRFSWAYMGVHERGRLATLAGVRLHARGSPGFYPLCALALLGNTTQPSVWGFPLSLSTGSLSPFWVQTKEQRHSLLCFSRTYPHTGAASLLLSKNWENRMSGELEGCSGENKKRTSLKSNEVLVEIWHDGDDCGNGETAWCTLLVPPAPPGCTPCYLVLTAVRETYR